jgi:hypothetical protein
METGKQNFRRTPTENWPMQIQRIQLDFVPGGDGALRRPRP